MEPKTLTLGQFWRQYCDGEFYWLSNAFVPILCTYHSSRDNGGFPKQCLVFPKVWVFGPWGAQFWLNSKMILVFLVDLVTPNQMPFTVCFYVASFSRSLGGGSVTRPPPPAGSKLAQTPAGARVNMYEIIVSVPLKMQSCIYVCWIGGPNVIKK